MPDLGLPSVALPRHPGGFLVDDVHSADGACVSPFTLAPFTIHVAPVWNYNAVRHSREKGGTPQLLARRGRASVWTLGHGGPTVRL